MQKGRKDALIHTIQLHERAWGTEMYAGRPDLETMLRAAVVVFWQQSVDDERWVVTIYPSLDDLERELTRVLLVPAPNNKRARIMRIFYKGQRIVITGLKVQFERAPDS